MGGRFNPASPPKRPGSYTNFVARPVSRVNPPLSGVLAMPIVADWGPLDEVVETNSIAEFRAIFGDSVDNAGYRAVMQAYKGEGINGKGGAARVYVIRKGAAAAKQAQAKLADTKEEPNAEAVLVKAIYKGTKGNDLSTRVVANATNPETEYDLVVYLDGAEIERFNYAKADANALKTAVNGVSDWVEVEVKKNEAALALLESPKALTEGNDGSTLEAAHWTAALASLAVKRFSVFVPYDLTDSSIITSIKTWAADPDTGLNNKGKRFTVVFGGKAADTLSEAVERSEELNDENIVNAGAFTVQDSTITDENNDPITLSSSQFAPRIAGVIAATGGSAAVTFSRFKDVTLVSGLSEDADFVEASENGVLTVAEDSNELAPVRVEQDVTTYIDDTEAKPKEIFGKLKFVRTMQSFEMALSDFNANKEVIGKLGVNDDTREYLTAQYRKIAEEYAARGEFSTEEETKVYVDPGHAPTPQDKYIPFVYEPYFGRDVEQIRNTVIVA